MHIAAKFLRIDAPGEDLLLVVLALGRRHHFLYKIPSDTLSLPGGDHDDGATATRISMDFGRVA